MTQLTLKLKDLNKGDWFSKVSSEYKNSYNVIAKDLVPNIAIVQCAGNLMEMDTDTEVTKIDGFQLYLLQGGRQWD